jgi:hypothetical protein
MEVGARDKGTDTGRNTININQLIVVKGNSKDGTMLS